jgi:hypothetical protein
VTGGCAIISGVIVPPRTRALGAAAALAAVALGGCGGGAKSTKPALGVPVKMSDLAPLVQSTGQAVYWAGPQGSPKFKLTRASAGRVFIQYLPKSGKPGPKGSLAIGTYKLPEPYRALKRAAGEPGAKSYSIAGGRVVVNSSHPTNAYLAYRTGAYQIEIYDPAPGRALDLVRSGQVTLAPGSPPQ